LFLLFLYSFPTRLSSYLYFFLVIINRILNSLLFDVDEILNLIINIFILISIVILYRISNNVALKQMIFIIIGYFIYFLFMFFVKVRKNTLLYSSHVSISF